MSASVEPRSLEHTDKSKSQRLEEWETLPLKSLDDIQKWYSYKAGQKTTFMNSIHTQPDPRPNYNQESVSGVSDTIHVSEISNTSEVTDDIIHVDESSALMDREEAFDTPDQTPIEGTTQARALEEENPDLYF